jgi:hypothetical protein
MPTDESIEILGLYRKYGQYCNVLGRNEFLLQIMEKKT